MIEEHSKLSVDHVIQIYDLKRRVEAIEKVLEVPETFMEETIENMNIIQARLDEHDRMLKSSCTKNPALTALITVIITFFVFVILGSNS